MFWKLASFNFFSCIVVQILLSNCCLIPNLLFDVKIFIDEPTLARLNLLQYNSTEVQDGPSVWRSKHIKNATPYLQPTSEAGQSWTVVNICSCSSIIIVAAYGLQRTLCSVHVLKMWILENNQYSLIFIVYTSSTANLLAIVELNDFVGINQMIAYSFNYTQIVFIYNINVISQ